MSFVSARRHFSLLLSSVLLFTLIVLPLAPNAPFTIAYAERLTEEAQQQLQDAERQDSEQQVYDSQELATPEAQLEQQLKTERRAKNAGKDKDAKLKEDTEFEKEASSNNDSNRQNDPCREIPGKESQLLKRCLESGGGSGVAKGDFNGDGFADLAVGVPSEDITFDNGTTAVNAGAVNIIYGSANGLTSTDSSVPAPQIFSQSSPGIPETSEAGDNFGSSLVSADINNDGLSDLIVGIPNEDVVVTKRDFFGRFSERRLVEHAGAILLIFGSSDGLRSGIPVSSEAAQVVFTQESFLSNFLRITPFLRFDAPCGRTTCMDFDDIHDHDHFGSSLAWGDFNKDGKAEFVVGAPDQDYVDRNSVGEIDGGTRTNAGAVYVFKRFFANFAVGDVFFQEDVTNRNTDGDAAPLAVSEEFDRFGSGLVAGKFDGDDFEDLAIGASGEDLSTLTNRGAIYVVYGRSELEFGCGQQNAGLQFFFAARCVLAKGVADRILGNAAELHLGNVLAAGDFNGDLKVDIAAGVPSANIRGQNAAGAVHIFVSDGDFVSSPSLIITQPTDGTASINGAPEAGDHFGAALASGDFNGDGYKDLAIGAPFEDAVINGTTFLKYGAVQFLLGNPNGLGNGNTRPRDFFIPPNSVLQSDANLGASLTAWDFGLNVDKRAATDLAIGVPGRNIGAVRNAGEVTVLYGKYSPVGTFAGFNSRVDFWNQSSPGIPGGAETNDRFGESLY